MTLHELLTELHALSALDEQDRITPAQRKRLVQLRALWQERAKPTGG